MKRKVLITALVLALCLLAAGCGAGSGRQPVQEADAPDTAGTGQQPENSVQEQDGKENEKQPEGGAGEAQTAAAVLQLEAASVSGAVPERLTAAGGDQSGEPCLLAGRFLTENGMTAFYAQLSPKLEPSGFGDLTADFQLPEGGTERLYGAVLQTVSQDETQCAAVFSLAPLLDVVPDGGDGQVNGRWTGAAGGIYLWPVCICLEDGDATLRSLTSDDVFRPAQALPGELREAAGSAPSADGTVPAGQCGVAAFSITAQESDIAYTVELAGFLLLAGG